MLNVSNNTTQATQIVGAYLDMEQSATDYQPYLEIGDWGRIDCSDNNYDPAFEVRNLGWGKVTNTHMHYALSRSRGTFKTTFDDPIGTFDTTTKANVNDGIKQLGVNLSRIKAGKFPCAADSQLPTCFAKLNGTGIFGNLSDKIYLSGNAVFTNASGYFEYTWTDNIGSLVNGKTPFQIAIPIMHFDVGGPECGAPGPAEVDFKPITMALDKSNYRLPLSLRGQLNSRKDRSFGFALVAKKSSHHVFHIVLELADGSSVTSPEVDLSYFLPRIPQEN